MIYQGGSFIIFPLSVYLLLKTDPGATSSSSKWLFRHFSSFQVSIHLSILTKLLFPFTYYCFAFDHATARRVRKYPTGTSAIPAPIQATKQAILSSRWQWESQQGRLHVLVACRRGPIPTISARYDMILVQSFPLHVRVFTFLSTNAAQTAAQPLTNLFGT